LTYSDVCDIIEDVMPCRTAAEQREYQRKWRQRRRQRAVSYLGRVCVYCGTTSDLQFDHIDPSTRTCFVNYILSSRWERLVEELDKCQLLCFGCHVQKNRVDGSTMKNTPCGEQINHAKLTVSDVLTIRCMAQGGMSQRQIASQYGLHHSTVGSVVRRETWKHV